MIRQWRVSRLLRRFGGDVQVEWDSHRVQIRAVIQPLYYKNNLYLEGSYLPDGYFDGNHFLYIGPVGVRLDQLPFDTLVLYAGKRLRVKRADLVRAAGVDLYVWAILEGCGEESDEPV